MGVFVFVCAEFVHIFFLMSALMVIGLMSVFTSSIPVMMGVVESPAYVNEPRSWF